MKHISFKNLLNEVSNPRLFELDEADELVFMIMKDFMTADKDFWQVLDNKIFQTKTSEDNSPVDVYLKRYIERNEEAMQLMQKNPNSKAPLYYYLVFELSQDELLQMKWNNKLGYDLGYIQALFIQQVIPEGFTIPDSEPNTFGESGAEGSTVAVVFNKNHTLTQLKRALTSVLVHELNHDYDRAEFNTQGFVYGTGDEGSFGANNVTQSEDQSKQLQYIFRLLNTRFYKSIVTNGMKEGIIWLTRIVEQKSITKEFLKYCDYNSIDYKNAYVEEMTSALHKWLENFMINRMGLNSILDKSSNPKEIDALVELYKRIFKYTKHAIQGIISKLNKGSNVRFRDIDLPTDRVYDLRNRLNKGQK